MLWSCAFPLICGNRFTPAFRETITIGAVSCPGCCAAPSARSRASSTRYVLRRGALLIRGPSRAMAPGSAEQREGCCTACGTRCSCRPRVVRSKREYKCQDQGKSERRAPLARHGERGRRRTRQDQISLEAWKPGRAWKPVKLRTARIRTERRKLVSSAGTILEKSELFSKMRSSRLT